MLIAPALHISAHVCDKCGRAVCAMPNRHFNRRPPWRLPLGWYTRPIDAGTIPRGGHRVIAERFGKIEHESQPHERPWFPADYKERGWE